MNEAKAERKAYHIRRQQAIQEKPCYTVILDGWDQSKTNIPWPGMKVKSTDKEFYVLKYVGVIVHGHGRLFFIVDHSVSNGCGDLTIEVTCTS